MATNANNLNVRGDLPAFDVNAMVDKAVAEGFDPQKANESPVAALAYLVGRHAADVVDPNQTEIDTAFLPGGRGNAVGLYKREGVSAEVWQRRILAAVTGRPVRLPGDPDPVGCAIEDVRAGTARPIGYTADPDLFADARGANPGRVVGSGRWFALIRELQEAHQRAARSGRAPVHEYARIRKWTVPAARKALRTAIGALRDFVRENQAWITDPAHAERRQRDLAAMYAVLVEIAGGDKDEPAPAASGGRYAEAAEHQASMAAHLRAYYEDLAVREDVFYNRQQYESTRQQLLNGEAFYIGATVATTVRESLSSFPDDWTLTPESLPVPAGFAWLERPIDLPNTPSRWCALSWGESVITDRTGVVKESGVHLTLYTYSPHRAPGLTQTPHPSYSFLWPYKETVKQMWAKGLRDAELWLRNQPAHVRARYGAVDEWMPAATLMIRFTAALFAFMETEVMVPERTAVDRATRRRLGWKLPPELAPSVRVIMLRRRQQRAAHPDQGDGGAVDWSCRWWVRGHWHRYWHKDAAGTRYAKAHWLAPYLKGDPSKPTKPVPDHLWAVIR